MENNIIRASLWSIFSELIAKVIGPISFLALTKILSPTDFGIVAIASTILGFVYIVSDLGIGKVIIQELGDKLYLENIYNVGFWLNTIMGFLLFVLMFLFSEKLASFYGNKESSDVIKVMSIQGLCYSLSALQIADRKKKFEFKFLFYMRLITVLSPLLISLPFAFMGFGYWAIVFGQVIGAICSTIFLWFKSDWRPKFNLDIKILKVLLAKSSWNTLEQVFVWLPLGIDTYLITNYLTLKDLGVYSTSRMLFSTAISLSLGAIIPVLFSLYSRIKLDEAKFNSTVLFTQKIIFFISSFIGVIGFVFSDLIEDFIFNEKWNGISDVFSIMFLILGFEYFSSALTEGLRAKGYFRITAISSMIMTFISIPILFYSIRYGLIIYVFFRSILLFLIDPMIFYFSKKILKISISNCLSNSRNVFLFIIIVLTIDFLTKFFLIPYVLKNIINLIFFSISFFLFLFLEINDLKKIKKILQNKHV